MKKYSNFGFILFLLVFLNFSYSQKRSSGSSSSSKMQISTQLGLALPLGTFGDAAGMGFGGCGTYIYNLNSELSITGGFSYFMFGKKSFSGSEFSYSIYPISAGVRYKVGKGSLVPFVGGELGFYTIAYSYTSSFNYQDLTATNGGGSTTQSYSGSYSGADTKIGIAPLIGFYDKIGKSIDLDVTAKFNYIPGDGGSTTFLTLNVGIAFGL